MNNCYTSPVVYWIVLLFLTFSIQAQQVVVKEAVIDWDPPETCGNQPGSAMILTFQGSVTRADFGLLPFWNWSFISESAE
ncbi:hypothetical protein EO238_29525, partial [Citrobacter sp. AAK_AS5]